MNIDSLNNAFYDEFGVLFDKVPFEDVLIPWFQKHASGQKVLEIGSGAGAFAAWMVENGFEVTCIEPAAKPAAQAAAKGLKVHITTLQNFKSDDRYEMVVAISSLIHISRSEIASQLEKIAGFLTNNGIFFLSLIEGEGEGFEDPTGKGKERFFSKFSENEMEELLLPHFLVLESQKINVKKMDQTFNLMVLKKL